MNNLAFLKGIKNIEILTFIIKMFFINMLTYYTCKRVVNVNNTNKKKVIMSIISSIVIAIICGILRYLYDSFISILCSILLLAIIYYINEKNNMGYSIIITTISFSINYALFFIAVILSFIPQIFILTQNDYISLTIIMTIYILLLYLFFRMKKFKYGISFLKNNIQNDYIDILVLNISAIILMGVVIISNYTRGVTRKFIFALLIFTIIMYITIQKSLQLYYKQKLLIKEIEETKEELAKKKKEVEDLEAENIEISKKSHTLVHKQKSLEYKLEEIINKTEISKEEVGEVTDRIKEIKKDLYKEKTTVELDKTGIAQIDDMLKFMQSECNKNKIDFELQVKGNIHYMTNNLIEKADLETLLADHIKNAIIAIKHTDNINRSILVRLGEIDGIYSLYIYDSGIEFEKSTLENLGKKPSTTHAYEGGTGMGFMNTFDTLRKCKASLIIEEYNEPSKENYTKVLMIKFDNKNEFKIKSYREHTL